MEKVANLAHGTAQAASLGQITHILRNAIDHGIEPSQERIENGKPATAILRLEAAHRFGMLSITISDDGRGINLEKLRETVIQKQLVNPEMGQQLTENELIEFIFLLGFSTANQVTEISSRGVGLNIAKTMVEEVGGNLQGISKPGKGMSFHYQGYIVDGAVDGMEGWNALVSGKYDLVITDIDMPRLNGIKLVNHIKKHPQLKSIQRDHCFL